MRGLWGLALCLTVMAYGDGARETIVGGPCEGCENVFVEMPESLSATARIASVDEPGERLIIEGTVRGTDARPTEGIVVYAYQTNADGIYPRGTTRHGRLRAWSRTDKNGWYRFDTIRPAAYPDGDIPQHVHMHVLEPGRVTYYIDDIVFDDDPLLTPSIRQRYVHRRGGDGVCHPEKNADGVWHVQRDITLGENIPNYQ